MKHFINDLRTLYRIWRLMRHNYYIMTFDNGTDGVCLYNLRSRKHFKQLLAITREMCQFK